MRSVEKIFKQLVKEGYRIEGSAFKVDYNGRIYTVGFWIKEQGTEDFKYTLPPYTGTAKHENFEQAVKLASKKAEQSRDIWMLEDDE